MADATPRQKRRRESTARILDVAQKLIESGGLEALTMQSLAAELGFTVGATYRYYAGKDELIAALQSRVLESLAADLRAAMERFEATRPRPGKLAPLVRLAVIARTYTTLTERRPTDAHLLAAMLADPRNLLTGPRGAANAQSALAVGSIATSALADAARADAVTEGDPMERALVLWAALQGVVQTKKLERWAVPGLAMDRLAEATVRTLLVGWGAEPARVKEALARACEIV